MTAGVSSSEGRSQSSGRDDSMMAGRCRRRWAQRDGQGWLNITQWTGGDNEGTRQLGMRCSEGQRGRWCVDISAVQNLSGVVALGREQRERKKRALVQGPSVMVIRFSLSLLSLPEASTCALLPASLPRSEPVDPYLTLMLKSPTPRATASCTSSWFRFMWLSSGLPPSARPRPHCSPSSPCPYRDFTHYRIDPRQGWPPTVFA